MNIPKKQRTVILLHFQIQEMFIFIDELKVNLVKISYSTSTFVCPEVFAEVFCGVYDLLYHLLA